MPTLASNIMRRAQQMVIRMGGWVGGWVDGWVAGWLGWRVSVKMLGIRTHAPVQLCWLGKWEGVQSIVQMLTTKMHEKREKV
jgi:hypothetical protein